MSAPEKGVTTGDEGNTFLIKIVSLEIEERPVSRVPGCVSMKSDMSMDPYNFSKEEPLSSE